MFWHSKSLKFRSLAMVKRVNAWTSNWIDTNLCVADFEVSIPNALSNARVVDLVDANGEWNLHIMNDWLPQNIGAT